VGKNSLHVASLLNTTSTIAIARYFISLYGESIVNTPYQVRKSISYPPDMYKGLTAIHIAIVNHDLDMVKYLVANGANPRAREHGPFFKKSGHCYFEERPHGQEDTSSCAPIQVAATPPGGVQGIKRNEKHRQNVLATILHCC
jgi:ankyrin repeat protein